MANQEALNNKWIATSVAFLVASNAFIIWFTHRQKRKSREAQMSTFEYEKQRVYIDKQAF